MKYFLVLILALATAAAQAQVRPLLVPPKHLQLPLPGEPQFIGQFDPEFFDVAIDGDVVLASAQRSINTNDDRVNGVYIFQRASDGRWNYASPLTEGSQTLESVQFSGNVAVTYALFNTGSFRIFERGAAGWSQTATITVAAQPFRVEDGSIFTRPNAPGNGQCAAPLNQYRKVNGTWQVVATIGGTRCGQDFPDFNDGRAVIVSTNANGSTLPTVPIYRNVNGAWPQVASIDQPPPQGNSPALSLGTLDSSLAYFSAGNLYRNAGNDSWQPAGTLVQPEVDLRTIDTGAPRLRGANLLLAGMERDYELPSHDTDHSFLWRTVRVYRPSANGTADYFARLNPDFALAGWAASEDGRRVAGFGRTTNEDVGETGFPTQLYVFEIPDSHTFPFLEQDNFESGNFGRWTPSAGQFQVAQNGSTHVLRQSSLAGDSGATLTALDWTDQAIEADLRPLGFSGSSHWFGLVTRRTDAQNFYYVTLRAPDIVSLRLLSNGVIKELAVGHAPEPFVLGRSYRVRLESVGDQHAAFLEGVPRAFIKDSTHTHGHPGIQGYRESFEADNVVVTGGTRLLTVHDGLENFYNSGAYTRGTGTGNWMENAIDDDQSSFHFFLRQTTTSGDARVFSRTPLTNQVVSARLRPITFGASQEAWFGVAARVVDANNYLYLTARRNNQLSLRRLVNGAVQVIAAVPVTVATNQWYDLRLEVVGNQVRAFVNGDLKIETSAAGLPESGRSGVLMYKTSADLWLWTTHRP